ncbi:MAG: cytidylate kinase family protein [Candidatus Micrarchaeales archaeon]|jgi:cytidylate kinase
MIICIAGLGGSGKTPIAESLAKKLKIRHITKSFKEISGDKENLVKFVNRVKKSVDTDLDAAVIKEANKGDCVVSTWLGPWMIKNADVKVWLNASLETRARRKAKTLHMTLNQAKKYLKNIEEKDRSRWKRLYGFDITKDHDIFDIEINTDKVKLNESVAVIAMLSLEKSKKRFG